MGGGLPLRPHTGNFGCLRRIPIRRTRSDEHDQPLLLRRFALVEETLSEVRGKIHIGPPKTKAAMRTVRLPIVAVSALTRHLEYMVLPQLAFVFTGRNGGTLRAANFRHRVWAKAVERSVGRPCRFHDLRHTHVAMLIAAEQSPSVIAKRLGHVSVRTVLDVYGHLYEGLMKGRRRPQ